MSVDWKNNPRLSGMDPQKLSMLQGLADQGLGKIRPNFCLLSWAQLLKEKMRA